MLVTTSLRVFYSGLMILLSIGATFFFRCDHEAKPQSQSGKKSEFSIVTSDADTIVYTPIDSILVIEFSEGLSKESKQSIIDEFNLKLLSISHSKKQALQTLEKSTLVFGCDQAENYRIRKEIKKNILKMLEVPCPHLHIVTLKNVLILDRQPLESYSI